MVEPAKGSVLPINELFNELVIDPFVRAEAADIIKTGNRGDRSQAAFEADALNGVAAQYAVAEHFRSLGFDVTLSGVKQYDLIINSVLVDVKTRWAGKFFQQSEWEAWRLKQTGERVLYLCVDAMPDGRFIYKGCTWLEELAPSSYGQPYVSLQLLRSGLIPTEG